MLTGAPVPSRLAALVLALGVALSAAAWWTIHNGVRQQEHALLNEYTSQAVVGLQAPIQRVSLELGAMGVGETVFDKQAAVLGAGPALTVGLVTKGVSDAHGNVDPGPPQVKFATGPALHAGEVLTGRLAQIAAAARSGLQASPVFQLGGRDVLVYSLVPAAIGLPGYVALQVVPLPPARQSTTRPIKPFRQLDIALYASPTPQPRQLLVSTRGLKPLHGPTASAQMTVESVQWDLVASARQPLLDRPARATPWIVFGVGLVLAVGLAIAVDRHQRLSAITAEKYEHERAVSEALQHSLLPRTLPTIPGMDIAARYVPSTGEAEVGGDWYSVIPVDDDTFAFVVGDVSGHGIQAAGMMASLRYTTRTLAKLGFAPNEVLDRADDEIDVMADHAFATVLVGTVSIPERQLTVASAGHPPPYVWSPGRAGFVELTTGAPLGVDLGPVKATTVAFPPGSKIVAFTDGLIERRDQEIDARLQCLAEAASYPSASAADLLAHVLATMVPGEHEDDIAILVITALPIPGAAHRG
jgi:serine phosphatase RsbU (regulator of sigma subunit)